MAKIDDLAQANYIPIPEIAEALVFENNYDLVVKSQVRQPIYFDTSENYHMWDKKNLCWVIIDKTDLFKSIVDITGRGSFVIGTKVKNEIAEAIRITGRARQVKPIDDSWIYCKNGVYDSKNKKIFTPSMEYFFTQPIPHNIGDSEETPIIDKLFIDWVGDRARVLYEICAYCLLDAYPIHRLFWLYGGRGRNGKDQFLEFLQRLVGAANAVATDLEMLTSSRFESSKLYKKKLAVISEVETTVLKNTGMIKALTGHSLLRGEFKGKDGFQFYNTAKILIASNNVPESTDKTRAFFARCVMLGFNGDFSGREFNKSIIDTIPEYEYENLIRKCFNKILPELLDYGEFFGEGTTEEKEADYERISNPFLAFKEKELIFKAGNKIPVWVLREIYNTFANKNNYRQMGMKEFPQTLTREGIETGREIMNGHKWNIAYGITIKNPHVYDENSKIKESFTGKSEEKSSEIHEKTPISDTKSSKPSIAGDVLDDLELKTHSVFMHIEPSGNTPSKSSKSSKTQNPVTDLDQLQTFMQKNYEHMKSPDSKTEMDWRTIQAVNNIKTKLKSPEEKAKMIWQDYCKVRNW